MSLLNAALLALGAGNRGPSADFFRSLAGSDALTTRLASSFVVVRAVAPLPIANLSAANVVQDGVTLLKGDLVLLVSQANPTENGVYEVGVVSGGAAPFTRAKPFVAGASIVEGLTVEVGDNGAIYGATTWKAMSAFGYKWGAADPSLYPRQCRASVPLVNGTVSVGSDIWLFSDTTNGQGASTVSVTRRGATGVSSDTVEYTVSSRVVGRAGTGAVTVEAVKADGSINAGDTSSVDITINNW